MTICPFCKKAVVNPSGGPCPSCGKADSNQRAVKAPVAGGAGGDDWDEIQHGSSASGASGPSSYAGGAMGGFGDDDEGGPGLSLELDGPARSLPPSSLPSDRSGLAPAPSLAPGSQPSLSQPPRGVGGSGGYPKHGDSVPQPLPARSGRPSSEPQMYPQSTPNLSQPPSQPMIGAQQPQMSMPPGFGGPPSGQPDPAAMIARYPAPPRAVWESPIYAMKVLIRQFELRQDIASLRKRRSPDVALYERALQTHNGAQLAIGLAITITALLIATTLFFMPVILRFTRD